MADSQGNDNSTCVVCFKNVLYYSIGECDHPVCFECSTRMRVLCLQNECPICRQDLARVVFTETVLPYKELRNKVFNDRLFERQFKIGFCTPEIKQEYDKLLENHCKLCDKIPPFRTFAMLSDHMRRVHERFFCDLCVKHLRIFTSERKCYTRQELAHHRRKGDLDDTSHRGHPLCEFCEERFMDADELYRHLRKEHLYCHLCDADGRNLYYASHAALAHHFRSDHFLCEEGECADQHLTSVFRSEIDLKAHKATVHGRGMNRGAARQARTLELQFNITPHPVAHRAPRNNEPRPEPQSPPPVQTPRIDTHSVEQFPRLSSAQPQPSLVLSPVKHYNMVDGLTRNERNFPALDGASASSTARAPRPNLQPVASIVSNSKPSVSIQLHSQPASASNFRLTQTSGNRISIPQHQKKTPLSDDDFPSLSRDDHPNIGAGTVQPPKVTMINSQEMKALSKSNQQSSHSRKAQHGGEAFPALAGGGAPVAPPTWITVSKPAKPGKAKDKPNKPEPPPQPSFNPVADFPTLPLNSKPTKTNNPINISKPKKATPQPVIKTDSKPSKKDKKKNNNNNVVKKENLEFDLVNEYEHVNGAIDKKIAREMSYVGISVNNAPKSEPSKKVQTIKAGEDSRNGGNGDFCLAARDYPPLSARVPSKEPEWPRKKEKPANGAPPGFKSRPACNGMTFTNSSGQTFSAPLHAYIQPADFEQRNRALVKKLSDALGGVSAVEEFKVASREFRDGVITAEAFYSHCESALGSKLDTVFPELVALLPDIGKQQELAAGRGLALEACGACGQLLAAADRAPHRAHHCPPL